MAHLQYHSGHRLLWGKSSGDQLVLLHQLCPLVMADWIQSDLREEIPLDLQGGPQTGLKEEVLLAFQGQEAQLISVKVVAEVERKMERTCQNVKVLGEVLEKRGRTSAVNG